jgi:replicative DNA helicase
MQTLDKVLINRAAQLKLDVQRRDSGEKLITHVPTGFRCIDDTYGGIRRGVATELMAHTGDGKSAIARQFAEATAKAGGGVLWFCGEDPEDATAERYLSDGANITATDIGRLELSKAQLAKLSTVAASSTSWASRILPIFEAPSVEDVIRTITQTTTIGGCPLLLVELDYMQIFGDSHNLEGEIAKLATACNNLSGERRIASLLLSQVVSDVYKRGREEWQSSHSISGFIPKLGDTEWCRRAEKSCKAVWSIFRPGRWLRDMGEDVEDSTGEFHVKKASFGPMGWEELLWDGPGVRFLNKG